VNTNKWIKNLCGLVIGCMSILANASTVSVIPSYDSASGYVEVDLLLNNPPQNMSDFAFQLDYSSAQANFLKVVYTNANVISYAGSKAGTNGQVSGSATIDFSKGNSPVKLYFSTLGQGTIEGLFKSITVGGQEVGPAALASFSFNGTPSSTPSPEVAPDKPIVSGLNHSLAVHWTHVADTVSGYRADAWMLSNSGGHLGPVASCHAGSGERTCVIQSLRNRRLYSVTVTAIYPDGTQLASVPSDPVIPAAGVVNGSCNPNVGINALTRALTPGQMCLNGRITGYSSDGVTSTWSCVDLGHGETQTCTAP
jgi:hypothetical protein